MAKRKLTIRDRKIIERQQAYSQAPVVGVLWPHVKTITVTTSFQDHPESPEANKQTRTYSEDSKAFFIIECRLVECVDGGHDLENVISSTIKAGQDRYSGMMTCQGWQDRDRVGQHRCFDMLKIQIQIVYS
jgi:hypothetical protein